MKPKGQNSKHNIIDRRLPLLIGLLVTMCVLLVGRLFYIQIVQHHHLTGLALKQQERTIQIQPARGSIYDRHGRPLALNRQVTSFYAVPTEIKKPAYTARRLSPILGVSSQKLTRRFKSKKAFVWIKRKVSDQAANRVKSLKLEGVHFLNESTRVYPEGSLASHILGFVGMDNQGLSGIELSYDRKIRGDYGWIRISRDAKGRRVPASTRIHKESEPGKDLYLTIDKVVQHVAEQALARGMEKTKAKHGSVIVMDPKTGEILAMANKPDYNPNQFGKYSSMERRNRAILDVYEPGSTFKVITAAAALEEGVFKEEVIIDCENGKGDFNGRIVRDHEPRGLLSFEDVLVFSSNVGAVKIGMRLGGDKLFHYTREFGFGRATGIELPGESKGLLPPLKYWENWRAISTPFGQGVAVTSLQMATAFATVANDGRLVKPWLVKALKTPNGTIVEKGKPEYKRQVISSETAKRLRTILGMAVERGTGTDAAITNYQVAGKTGTAQKPKKKGRGYDEKYHVGSFIGFFPEEDPELLISVVIDSPKDIQWGGLVAGPVFNEVGQQLVAYLGIPPGPKKVFSFAKAEDVNEPEKLGGLVEVPNCLNHDISESKKSLKAAGLKAVTIGSGRQVVGQRPLANALINQESRVVLYLGQADKQVDLDDKFKQVVVPDLTGQSMRNAIQIINAYGLNVKVTGSGVVDHQTPRAYAQVNVGESCLINCQDPEKVK